MFWMLVVETIAKIGEVNQSDLPGVGDLPVNASFRLFERQGDAFGLLEVHGLTRLFGPLYRFQSTRLTALALRALPHNNVIADIDDIFSILAIEPLHNKTSSLLSDRT